MFVFVVLQSYTNMHVLLLTPLVMLQFKPWCHPSLASLSYSVGQGISLQSNQVKRFAHESRFGFVVQNLNPFLVRTSQIEIEKRTSRVKPRFE